MWTVLLVQPGCFIVESQATQKLRDFTQQSFYYLQFCGSEFEWPRGNVYRGTLWCCLEWLLWTGTQGSQVTSIVSGATLSTVGWKPLPPSAQPSSSRTAWTCLLDSWVSKGKVKFASPRGPGLLNSQKITFTHFPGQIKTRHEASSDSRGGDMDFISACHCKGVWT